MGTCSCINSEATRPDVNLDPQRIKEISKQKHKKIYCKYLIFLKLASYIKGNKKIFFLLNRVQARIKGLITRNKVRNMARHRRFMPNDSYNKYTTVNNSKIVSFSRN
jgi:hypothetical protein